jgi:signal transduction histidine kinase
MSELERLRDVLLLLERTRLLEEETRRTSDAMVRCLRALALESDPTAVFDALLPELVASLDADGGFVLASSGEGDGLTVIAASEPTRVGGTWQRAGLFAKLGPARPTAAVFDVGLLPEWEPHRAEAAAVSALLLHIGTPGKPAFLCCTSAKRGHFQASHLALAGAIAPVAAQAIARADDHRRLRLEIAERMRVEAELKTQQARMVHMQKMEAVAQLAGGLAHEINTPLQFASDNLRFVTGAVAAITGVVPTLASWLEPHMDKALLKGFLEAADIEYLAAEAPKAAEQCREGLDRVGAIVRNLKAFAQSDTGGVEPAYLDDAVRTTIEVCGDELADSAVVTTVLGGLPPVPCRIGEIRQVLHGLLQNARQAIEDRGHGRGRIAITTSLGATWAELAVEDDGCGMDAEVLRRACEPFFTTRPIGTGSGQGLAIAHEVLRRHGGDLTLASQPGQGTKVTLRLPLDPANPLKPEG